MSKLKLGRRGIWSGSSGNALTAYNPEVGTGQFAGGTNGNSVIGKKEQQRKTPITPYDHRKGIFSVKEIVFQNKMVREVSKTHTIPKIGSGLHGVHKADSSPQFKRTESRYERGVKRAIYQPILAVGAVVLLGMGANAVFGDDSSPSAALSGTTETTGVGTETSQPSVFVADGGETTTTVVAAAETPATPTTIAATAISAILLPGAAGPEVAELQTELMKIGCDVGADGADGHMGPNTVAGLKTFQTNEGISADGQYGPDSAAHLTGELQAARTSCGSL